MLSPSVPSLWQKPDQKSLRVAVARCIQLLQREHGLSLPEIAHVAGCTPETIRLAWKQESTLGLELWSNLRFYFRESAHCFLPYDQLVDPDTACDATPTAEDRLESACSEIRKALIALEQKAKDAGLRAVA